MTFDNVENQARSFPTIRKNEIVKKILYYGTYLNKPSVSHSFILETPLLISGNLVSLSGSAFISPIVWTRLETAQTLLGSSNIIQNIIMNDKEVPL